MSATKKVNNMSWANVAGNTQKVNKKVKNQDNQNKKSSINDDILEREKNKKYKFDEIQETMKTVCCERAESVKKACYDLYKCINRPNPTQLSEI